MDVDERWARGCGSGGIGYSSHVNVGDYSTSVKIGNWVEDVAKSDYQQTGRHVLGYAGQFRGETTHAASYHDMGKTGIDLQNSYARDDLSADVCVAPNVLFTHGDFKGPAIECQATVNQLTLGEKRKGEPAVQQYLWAGSKFNDLKVPVSATTTTMLTSKKQQWHQQQHEDMYATSSNSAALAAASAAALNNPKRGTLRPQAVDGQPSQVGRIPKGPFVEELDKEYQKTGLREP